MKFVKKRGCQKLLIHQRKAPNSSKEKYQKQKLHIKEKEKRKEKKQKKTKKRKEEKRKKRKYIKKKKYDVGKLTKKKGTWIVYNIG